MILWGIFTSQLSRGRVREGMQLDTSGPAHWRVAEAGVLDGVCLVSREGRVLRLSETAVAQFVGEVGVSAAEDLVHARDREVSSVRGNEVGPTASNAFTRGAAHGYFDGQSPICRCEVPMDVGRLHAQGAMCMENVPPADRSRS